MKNLQEIPETQFVNNQPDKPGEKPIQPVKEPGKEEPEKPITEPEKEKPTVPNRERPFTDPDKAIPSKDPGKDEPLIQPHDHLYRLVDM